MNPTDELRAAATKLHEIAKNATPGPWRAHDTWLDAGGHTATVLTDRDDLNETALVAWLPTFSAEPWSDGRNAWNNSAWIALANPTFAEHFAGILEGAAALIGQHPDLAREHVDGEPCGSPHCQIVTHALAVARAVLGSGR